jgi:DNA-binding NarL/FixJ family response regulator
MSGVIKQTAVIDRPQGTTGGSVFVVSRLYLITQSVRAGLADRGLPVHALPHPGDAAGWALSDAVDPADVVLLLDDLESREDVRRARSMMAECPAHWLVLTALPAGPSWGELLESGAAAIMSSSSTLLEVDNAVTSLRTGADVMEPDVRDRVLAEWSVVRDEQRVLLARMQRLSPRERTVLRMLYGGDRVPSIAVRLGVTEATVRSQVKSMLRKLGVNSQLSAVAALHQLMAFDSQWDAAPRIPVQRGR